MILKATSFADVADLVEYNNRVRKGMSPQKALNFGDNGLGSTQLSTVAGTGPCVAMAKPWASRKVRVTLKNGKTLIAEVRDTGPKGVVDLNPDACAALGLKPPVMEQGASVEWIL